jgi:putative tryptophan/tyrosine transport system substrate-binding protein
MDRRRFLLTSVAGVVAMPHAGAAQQGTVPRVGWLSLFPGSDPQVHRSVDVFRQALRDLGHVEGQSFAIEYRWAEGKSERLLDLATELVRLKVAVIVASGGVPPAQAAQRATKAIPIIFTGPADPVAAGLVASLARPGGNITGPTLISDQLMGKGLELLREVVPNVTRVAVLWNPTNPGNTHQLRGAEAAAAASGVRLLPVEARAPAEIDRAFVAMARERAGALLALLDVIFYDQRERITALAAKNRLPAVYPYSVFAEAGGLVSYGASRFDLYRQTAAYVDKILKGAKPANLPVEQPTTFELMINLKTAKALGLRIPPSLLARADQIIE